MMKPYKWIKQFLDYMLAIVLSLSLSPILLIISIIIKLDSKGPVLFKQRRIGKNKKEFNIYKFRTMKTDTPKDLPTHLFGNPEIYITKFGRFLRRSSLDELPQLFNIIRGQMSFIGPRPALWNQYDLIEARDGSSSEEVIDQSLKANISANAIKPGITGWAQVNGRDELPIQIKAAYDRYYANNISVKLDFKILFLTLGNVLTSKGVSEGGPKNN